MGWPMPPGGIVPDAAGATDWPAETESPGWRDSSAGGMERGGSVGRIACAVGPHAQAISPTTLIKVRRDIDFIAPNGRPAREILFNEEPGSVARRRSAARRLARA